MPLIEYDVAVRSPSRPDALGNVGEDSVVMSSGFLSLSLFLTIL